MTTEIRPTPITNAFRASIENGIHAEWEEYTNDQWQGLASKLERQRDSAKTLNRSLLDQLEAQAVQLEAMREAIGAAYESLNVSTTFGTTPKQDQARAKLQPFLKP